MAFEPFDGASPEKIDQILSGTGAKSTSAIILGAALLRNPRSGARQATLIVSPNGDASTYTVELQVSETGTGGWITDSSRDQDGDKIDTVNISPSLYYRLNMSAVASGGKVGVTLTV